MKFKEAVVDYDKGLDLDPDIPALHYNRKDEYLINDQQIFPPSKHYDKVKYVNCNY